MPLVLSCEHARAELPPGLELGLDPEALRSHIAWDPGALPLAAFLAMRLGAPLLAGQVSRLVVDLNRRATHDDALPAVAFGTPVPGNQGLSLAQRDQRIQAFHAPYRRALQAEVAFAFATGPCLHLSVHSFSPDLAPAERDFDLGLLFDPARPAELRLALALKEALSARGFDVRLNEPYLGTDEGCTTWLREQYPDPGYAGLELELSQRLSAPRQDELALALCAALPRITP